MPRVHPRLVDHSLPCKTCDSVVTSGTIYVEIVLYILIQVIIFLSRRVRLDRLRHTFVLAQMPTWTPALWKDWKIWNHEVWRLSELPQTTNLGPSFESSTTCRVRQSFVFGLVMSCWGPEHSADAQGSFSRLLTHCLPEKSCEHRTGFRRYLRTNSGIYFDTGLHFSSPIAALDRPRHTFEFTSHCGSK